MTARPEPAALAAPRTAAAIDAASQAARALADALAEAAAALSAETSAGPAPDGSTAPPRVRPPVPPGARRTAPRPPPGILDDSVAAAQHLVALSGVVLLVDGYNVAKTAWPTASLPEQRQRLIDALAELHARSGATVEVVFDGTDGADPRAAGSRQAVQVRFSPGGVAADDVVLAMIEDVPVHRPVVVASSDNAVRDGARSRGAAVLSARQMVAALRR